MSKLKQFWSWIKRNFVKLLAILGLGVAMAAGIPAINSFEKLDNVSKTDTGFEISYDKYSKVELKDDTPEATLRKWDETFIKISPSVVPTKSLGGVAKLVQEDGKLKAKGDKREIHMYPVENGFEYEVILKEKPESNIISFNIETEGLNFYYQPELTQKEKDEGAFRPENVIGSYAVYHESKAGDYEALGGKNYKAGKFGHIYRPKITDAKGDWKWEELNIDAENGKLTITIPQKFLDNAVYPISSRGVNFGYETAGTTGNTGIASEVTGDEYLVGTSYNLSSAGDISALTAYLSGNQADAQIAIYKEDGEGANSHTYVDDGIKATPTMDDWNEVAVSGSLTIGNYILCAIGDVSDLGNYESIYLKYDTTGANNYYNDISLAFGLIPTTWNNTEDGTGTNFSIYATYTAAGGGEAAPIPQVISY